MFKYRDDRGQAIALVAVSMVVLIGFMGLALDVGYMRYVKRQLQKTADAAAVAGALELVSCTSSDCSALTTAAQNAVTENGYSSSTLVTASSSCVGTSGLTVTVNNPPLCLGSTSADPHYNNKGYVEVTVSEVVPTPFLLSFWGEE